MDPDANLKEQREIAARLASNEVFMRVEAANRLAELVLALDEWISKGGFLPKDWTAKPKP